MSLKIGQVVYWLCQPSRYKATEPGPVEVTSGNVISWDDTVVGVVQHAYLGDIIRFVERGLVYTTEEEAKAYRDIANAIV